MKFLFCLIALFAALGCTTTGRNVKTVERVDIEKFMGDWYVLAGRFTFLEKDVHNGIERYTSNKEKNRIDVDFTYNQGSFTGKKKAIPQTGRIYNQETKAHWKVSPGWWPIKFDYLVVALDENYKWTAIGVPNQNYLWIMARDWKNPEPIIESAVQQLNAIGYSTKNLVRVPHQWP